MKEVLRARRAVPVFPLPALVFFPYAAVPLHIFEPRYRRMTEDALETDRLIALALLQPGWEGDYQGSPPVHAVACAGLIEQEVRLPDGRFNLQLRGVTRVEIRDFVQDSPYRVATVRVLDDQNEDGGEEVEGEKRRLLASCASLLQEISGAGQHPMALDTGVPFALIVNTLCQTLALDPTAKQQLLEQNDLLLRCRSLIDILDRRWQEIALRHVDQNGSPGEVH